MVTLVPNALKSADVDKEAAAALCNRIESGIDRNNQRERAAANSFTFAVMGYIASGRRLQAVR